MKEVTGAGDEWGGFFPFSLCCEDVSKDPGQPSTCFCRSLPHSVETDGPCCWNNCHANCAVCGPSHLSESWTQMHVCCPLSQGLGYQQCRYCRFKDVRNGRGLSLIPLFELPSSSIPTPLLWALKEPWRQRASNRILDRCVLEIHLGRIFKFSLHRERLTQ